MAWNEFIQDISDRAARILGKVEVTATPSIPAGTNIIGQVKLTDGTDVLAVNTNGSINIVHLNTGGTELFTTTNPAAVKNLAGALITAPITRIVTLTETPVAINSKTNIRQISIRNIDAAIRARIGETGMTPANGKGFALEPSAIIQESFDPTTAVSIYGRSEGAAIQVEVYES